MLNFYLKRSIFHTFIVTTFLAKVHYFFFFFVLRARQITDMKIDCPGTVSPPTSLKVWPDDKHDQVFCFVFNYIYFVLEGSQRTRITLEQTHPHFTVQNKLLAFRVWRVSLVYSSACWKHGDSQDFFHISLGHCLLTLQHLIYKSMFSCAIKGLYIALR